MSNCKRPMTAPSVLGRTQRVLYVTGPIGPQGLRGIQGEQGPTGPAGPTGPTGPSPFTAYATFFNNHPVTIPPSCTVPLPYALICTLPNNIGLVNNCIVLCEPGVYMVDYTIYTEPDKTATFGVLLCDNLIIGSATESTNVNHANVLITTCLPQQLIRLANIGENDATLINPKCSVSNVIVTVIKINN